MKTILRLIRYILIILLSPVFLVWWLVDEKMGWENKNINKTYNKPYKDLTLLQKYYITFIKKEK